MKNLGLAATFVLCLVLALPAFAFFGFSGVSEEECTQKGIEEWAFGGGECLRVITENPIEEPTALVVFLHGDVSKGGPADYLAKRMVRINPTENRITAVAIMRPGYSDSNSNKSSGSDNGRRDHYTERNIAAVAEAIENLKHAYEPKATIIVGHSGGAAMAGVIAGLYPNLATAYVLGACPCDVPAWRESRGRSAWRNSLSPSDFAGSIKPKTKVFVLSGSDDDNTTPGLIENYAQLLLRHRIAVEHISLEGVSHNGVARNDGFFSTIERLALGQ